MWKQWWENAEFENETGYGWGVKKMALYEHGWHEKMTVTLFEQ